jgi:hypothetical protein
VGVIASTFTSIKVPLVINWAALLGTDAISSDGVKSLEGIVAVLQFISARAVQVHVVHCSPDELSGFTNDQLIRVRVATWLQYSSHCCDKMLDLSLS